MIVDQTLADIIVPKLNIMILGMFDDVGEFYLTDIQRYHNASLQDLSHVVYVFNVDVVKYGRRLPIELACRVTHNGTEYPRIGVNVMTGKAFNLDQKSIDRDLFNKKMD